LQKEGKAYDEACYCELFCQVCPACDCYVVEEGAVALGTTYHPWCLVCSHCGEQLTTTVHKNGEGKLFCEQDFLALCAHSCARCGGVIEEESLAALDRHWHPWCFTCSFAGGCTVNLGAYRVLVLGACGWGSRSTVRRSRCRGYLCFPALAAESESGFHDIDNKPYCAEHFADLKGKPCARCNRGIMPGEELTVREAARSLQRTPQHTHCSA